MKRFFVTVFALAVAAMIVYGVKYAITPVNTQKLEYITQEDAINTNGFIIRDEWVMYTRSAGTVYSSVSEGARVAKDSAVGIFFYGDVGADKIKELGMTDAELKSARIEEDSGSSAYLDSSNIENNIYTREKSIIDASAENDIQTISGYKNDINILRQGGSLSADGEVEQLENRKSQILSDIGVRYEEIYAQISGLFTTYVDGYEELLVPADIESYDVSYFESLSQSPEVTRIDSSVDAGGAVCKIVNNHIWYVLLDIPADSMSGRAEGDKVRLRFNSIDEVVTGTVNSVSEETDGRVTVTVKCQTYLESAYSYRLVDVDLIFESYDGYKIPIQAVRTGEDGTKKVIGISENRQYDCECEVLFTNSDGGWAIVDSAEDAENKLSDMDRIMIGER